MEGGFCITPRKGSIQYEQHLWSECSRLIANCIIYYRPLLSHLLAQKESRGDMQGTAKSELHRMCGVDLTKIPGIKEQAAQIIISEVGLDMTRWNTEKQFSSFLGLCPNNSIRSNLRGVSPRQRGEETLTFMLNLWNTWNITS